MRLLFCFFKYFPYGGLQKDCLAIAKACVARGHTVHLLTGSWQGEKPEGITVTVFNTRGFTHYGWTKNFIASAQQYFSRHDFDLIVGFNRIPGIDVYYAADRCYREKFLHLPWYKRINPRTRAYARAEKELCAQPNTHLLLLTPQEKDTYLHHYRLNTAAIHVLPPGITAGEYPLEDYTPAKQAALKQHYGIASQDKLILFVGSAFKTKGLDRALLALASLPKAVQQDLHMLVVGAGKPRIYQRLSHTLDLHAKITFLGGRADVPQLMRAADLFLHPAYDDNAGNVLIEAMASSLPILTTDACGYAQYVLQAQAGCSARLPFKQAELDHLLLNMLTQKDLNQMRSAGLNFCREHPLTARLNKAVDLITGFAGTAQRSRLDLGWSRYTPPYHLLLDDGSYLQLEAILREVPLKRWVARANWQGKTVAAKMFAHKKKFLRELAGIERCHQAGILIPRILYQGRIQDENLFILLFEWIEKNSDAKVHSAEDLVQIVAQHHSKGIMQNDIHNDNFIKQDDQMVTLDAAAIAWLKNPLDNLALLLAQFWTLSNEHIQFYLNMYCKLQGIEHIKDVDAFIKKVESFKEKRKYSKIKTLFRNSSTVTVWVGNRYKIFLRNDAYTPRLCAALHQIAEHDERTALQQIDDYLLESYHASGLLSTTGAPNRWRDTHICEFTGVPADRPVALIEKNKLFNKTAYFIAKRKEETHAPD